MACRDVNQSAIAEARDQLFLDRADEIRLNVVTTNLGLDRPTVGTDDDEWRALAKVVALQPKQIRNIFYRLLEICVGPQKTRVAYTDDDGALVNDTSLVVENPADIIQVGTLVFEPGIVGAEETIDFCYRDLVTGRVFFSTPLTIAHPHVDSASSYLASTTAAGAATLVLNSTDDFPTSGFPYSIIIDEGTDSEEILVVASNTTGTATLGLSGTTTLDHLGPKARGFIRRPLVTDAITGRDFLQFDADATRVFPKAGWVRLAFGEANQEVVEYGSNDIDVDVLWLESPLTDDHVAGESVEYVTPGALVRTSPVIQRGIPWEVHETEPRKVKICIPEEVLTRRLVDASYLHDVSPPAFTTATTANAFTGDTILEVADTSGFRATTGAILVTGPLQLQFAEIVDATHLRLTYPLAGNLASGAAVAALQENYTSTDLEEGNFRLSNGQLDPDATNWPGPYLYDVLQQGVSLLQTTLTAKVPPPSRVASHQAVAHNCLEVEDVSLWPAAPYTVRVGVGTGFTEDRTCVDVTLKKGLSTTVVSNVDPLTLEVADSSGFPESDGVRPAGYRIIVAAGTINEETLRVSQNTTLSDTFTLESAASIVHLIGQTVTLVHDVLTLDTLQQPHRATEIVPGAYPGHRLGHRVDIIQSALTVASTSDFPEVGTIWLNFGHNRPSIRRKIASVVSTTVLEFSSTADFPTTNFPYQIVIGEGRPNQELGLVSANNTGTNRLTLNAAMVATFVAGDYVEFRAGVPTTVAFRDVDLGNIDLDQPTIFDSGYTIGETVIVSPGDSIPSAFGTDYGFRLPPSPVACVANLVDLVRAAGVEVFLLENCKQPPALPEEEEEEEPPEVGDEMDEGTITLSTIYPNETAGGGTEYVQTFRVDISDFDGFANLHLEFAIDAEATADSEGGSVSFRLGGTDDGFPGDSPSDSGTTIVSFSIPDNTARTGYTDDLVITNPGAGVIVLRVLMNGGASEEGDFPFILYSAVITLRGEP